MSAFKYRPICDFWILARAKLKPFPDGRKRTYWGAYLGGFPERARRLIGCSINDPLLHVCGGMAKFYPYADGFGPNDRTLDIDPLVEPDILGDAEVCIPYGWGGILIDPPYSPEDATHYANPNYPNPNRLVANAINAVDLGKKVGMIHYVIPRCPKNGKFVACVGISCGFNNRIRAFSVFEKCE